MTERKIRAVWMSERYWRKNRFVRSFAVLSVVALAATGTFAVEEAASQSGVGLSGIYPTATPADLSDEEFAKLDGNWADWSKGAAAAVAEFYSKYSSLDASEQRKALGPLKVKLDVMRRALDDPSYVSLHAPLTSLYNSLALRIDVAEAILDTLDSGNPQAVTEKAKARSEELLNSIKALEKDLSTIGNGGLWLPYFKVDALKTALSADPTNANALAAAKQSQSVLAKRDALEAAQKEFTHRASFDALAGALNRYLAAAGWVQNPDAVKNLRGEIKSLVDTLETFETTGDKVKELRQSLTKFRMASADSGDRVMSALQKRLFNYNVRVLVTEDFMNKLMSQTRTEQGPVVDQVMEAAVSGNQTTETRVSVNLKPSNSTARFDLVLNGHIMSSTVGVTPDASVWTSGNHTFVAEKEINFDGQNFSTRPALISVNPHNTTTGISTRMSGGLFGGIAQNIASREVEARRGQAEAIAASRVRENVLPKFNREVDANFAKEGAKLNNELFAGLRSTGLFPDAYSYQTTERLLTVNARLMAESQVGANVPENSLLRVKGATALIHESVLNNVMDQIGFAGQTLTEPELREKIEAFLSKALNRPFKFDAPEKPYEATEGDEEKSVNGIIFANEDPVRFRVENGELVITIRAGFKQEGKDDIPMREVVVPISFEVQGQKILAKRGNVQVSAAEGQGGGISINAVVRKKIQSVLPDREVDGKVQIKGPQKTVVAYVSELKLIDGWVSVSAE